MNSKAINASVLWFVCAVGAYMFCMSHDDYALKYYPKIHEFHFHTSAVAKADQFARTKFCNTAVMCMLLALPALGVGLLLPRRSAVALHLLAWATLLVVSVLVIRNQLEWFHPAG